MEVALNALGIHGNLWSCLQTHRLTLGDFLAFEIDGGFGGFPKLGVQFSGLHKEGFIVSILGSCLWKPPNPVPEIPLCCPAAFLA